MTDHTPGPWEVIGRHIYQIEEVGGRGVLHGGSVKGLTDERIEANVRLIAAAPELLGCLQGAVEYFEADYDQPPWFNAAVKAIARATGEE